MDTNIIFLDFDGPIIPGRSYFIYDMYDNDIVGGKTFDTLAVGMINRICVTYNVKVVISSTWRILGFKKVTKYLKEAGFNLKHLHKDWETRRSDTAPRADEISDWLKEHPEVEKYICIDDEDIKGHPLVRVTFDDGMTLEKFQELETFWSGKEQKLIMLG